MQRDGVRPNCFWLFGLIFWAFFGLIFCGNWALLGFLSLCFGRCGRKGVSSGAETMVALTLARSALSLTPYMSKPPGMSVLLLFFTTLGFSFGFVTPLAQDHRYNVGDHVSLFVNKVGPLNNPR